MQPANFKTLLYQLRGLIKPDVSLTQVAVGKQKLSDSQFREIKKEFPQYRVSQILDENNYIKLERTNL